MASGGSSGRIGSGSGSRSFDFGTDDVLCSYDDLLNQNQDASNGMRSDSPGKDFRDRRTGRPLPSVYSQHESYNKQDIISAVDKCMKKYADNLLSFLEGISGRLSQLEDYCYSLERSIGDLRSDLVHDQKESDSKLKSLEKHIQEVHRSVQILRDKQELAETQKELAKLQLAQKESSEGLASSDQKKHESPDTANQQLAIALPQQAVSQPPLKESPVQQPTPPIYIPQQNQLSTQSPQLQQGTSLQPEIRYVQQGPQTQDLSGHPLQQQQQQQPSAVSQTQLPAFTHYQQQWPQQTPQQFPQQTLQQFPQQTSQQFPQAPQQFPQQVAQQQQQGAPQAQFRPQSPPVYPPYPSQQSAKVPAETFPGNAPMPATYTMIPQSGGNRPEAVPFGYGGPGGAVQQPLPSLPNMQRQTQPPTSQALPGAHLNNSGYMGGASFSPATNATGYMMYGSDGSRAAHSQPFPSGSYSPSPNQQPTPFHHPGTASIRSHPYGELLEKAISMGYARDQVLTAIYRMEESGKPIDFNALLDMLNAGTSGSQRGW